MARTTIASVNKSAGELTSWQEQDNPILSDTVNLEDNGLYNSRGIEFDAGGVVSVMLESESDFRLRSVTAGRIYPWAVKRIGTTGTTVVNTNIWIGR